MFASAQDRILEYRSVDPESNTIFEIERENGGYGERYVYITESRSKPKRLVRKTFGNVFSTFLTADGTFLITNEGTGSAGIYPSVSKRNGDIWIEHVTPEHILSQLEPLIKVAHQEFKSDSLYRVYAQIRCIKDNVGYMSLTGEFERQGREHIQFGEMTFTLDFNSKKISTVDPNLVPKSMFRGQYSINSIFGSGFAISNNYVLTNNHVVKGHEKVWVGVANRETLGRVVSRSEQYDLALIKLEGDLPVTPLQLASESLKLGQTIMVLGYPLPSIQGYTAKATSGVVSSEYGLRDDPNQFQISAPVQPGSSGGPVISEDGLVLGVVVSTLSKAKMIKNEGVLPENVNLCIHQEIIRSFIRSFDESLILQHVRDKAKLSLGLSCVQIVAE